MPSFDVNTIIVCASAFPIVFGLSLVTLSRRQPIRLHWLFAAILFGIAGELIGFRAVLPKWSYTVFANLLIGASVVLIHRGTLVMLGRTPPDRLYAVALAALGGLYVWFTFVAENVPWRLFVISMFRVPFFLGAAWAIWPTVRQGRPRGARLLFWVMLAASAWFLYRGGLALSSDAMAAQVRVGWLQGINFLVGTLVHLLIVMILFRMELETALFTADRLAADLRGHRAALESVVERRTRELERAVADAQAANRAKSFFLASMSHEIRTPMSGVLGLSQLLAEDGRLTSEQRRRVETIQASAEGLLTILNDILDWSKLEFGNLRLDPAPVDLCRLVDTAVSLMRPCADGKGLRLDVYLDPDLPAMVVVDASRLRQVIVNLLSNAVKFTETGGVILAMSRMERDRLKLDVVDTGIGIAAEHHGVLFGDFVQLGADAGGAGLGLAICRRLVDLMGGVITLRSAAGKGSRFTAELPLLEASEARPAPERRAGALPPLRVLVAEDNEINQMVFEGLLSRDGHAVTIVPDGEAAVAAVRAGGFDLVLMDCRMPRLDGLEATRRIRRLGGAAARVPIVGVSANAFEEDVRRCRDAGMDGHLAKPITSESLEAAIARALRPSSSVPAG